MASVEFPYYFNLITSNAAEVVATYTTAVKLVESIPFVSSSQSVSLNAWTTAANMNIARFVPGGTGTQSAALAVGSHSSYGVLSTEKWNLNVWATSGSLALGRSNACGIQSAALSAGGAYSLSSERFNGSTWSAGPALLANQDDGSLCGTQSAALLLGGEDDNDDEVLYTQRFNGSSWVFSHDLPLAVWNPSSAAGTQTSAVALASSTTLLYNGTSWSIGVTYPAAAGFVETGNVSLSGVKSAALAAGGYNYNGSSSVSIASSYKFNGSVWSATGSLVQARDQMGTAGSQNSALFFGGGFFTVLTEKFLGSYLSQSVSPKIHLVTPSVRTDLISVKRKILNPGEVAFFDPGYAVGTVDSAGGSVSGQATYDDLNAISRIETASAGGTVWAAGPSLNTPHSATSALGTFIAPLVVGGSTAYLAGGEFFTRTAACEKLVGIAWASAASVSEARAGTGSSGIQSAGLAFGGHRSFAANGNSSATDAYNGSTWSARSAMLGSGSVSGGGTQSATIAVKNSDLNANEKYNGTAWSSIARMLTNAVSPAGTVCGSQTAALVVTGVLVTEKFNGTTWALSQNLLVTQRSSSGSQNNALAAGNQTAQGYNGTAWSMLSSPLILRVNMPQAGTSGAGIAISGQSSTGGGNTHFNSTERFVGTPSQAGYSRRIGSAYPLTLIQG